MVTRNDGTGGTDQALFSYATVDPVTSSTRANGNDLLMINPTVTTLLFGQTATFINGNHDLTYNRPALLSTEQGNGSDIAIGLDGDTTRGAYANNQTVYDGGTLIIGQEQDAMGVVSQFALAQQLEGDVAELIISSKRVSSDKADKIRSYLAIKYGIFLKHDYVDSYGNVIWDKTANSDYDKNVAGIGRDDALKLNHILSRSQDTAAIVTMEKTSASGITTDTTFLLWGSLKFRPSSTDAANYEVINSVDAPTDFTISERRWKVSNPGNRMGAVTVYMDIPALTPSLTGVRLLISSSPSFASGFLTAVQGTPNISTGRIEFNGVVLEDGQYFTLGFDQDLSFTNNDPGAPSTFEACAGSNVTFRYDTLPTHPVTVRFSSIDGQPAIQSVSPTNQAPGSGNIGVKGEITFDVPPNAATGNVVFLDGAGDIIYNSNAFITIHNPTLAILPQTDPVCADRNIRLYGFPEGGTFSSSIAGLISPSQDSLYAWAAGWGANHEDSMVVDVTYSFEAEYSNGGRCAIPKTRTENITIRDNRLSGLTYATVVKINPPNPNKPLAVDASTILTSTPNLLPPATFPHPFTFTGTYVTPGNEFLVDQSLASNPVTFRFNNKGCIGEQTSDIDVFNPLGIPGLPDTLCAESDTIFFFRDSTPQNAYSQATIVNPNGVIDSNIIADVITDSAYQAAIIVLDSTNGSERYGLLPSLLPPGTNAVRIRMVYRTTRTLNSAPNSPTTLYEFSAFSTVFIVPRPNVDVGTSVQSVYCTSEAPDTLRPSPAFDNISTTYFNIVAQDTSGFFTLTDTLTEDSIFVASSVYDSLVPNPTRDLSALVIYTVDRYGCIDYDTATTVIRAPRRPFFATRDAYCRNGDPFSLTGTLPGGITGRFEPAIGLNDSLGVFDPTLAAVDTTPVTLIITDQYGCEYDYTGNIVVREPPELALNIDGRSDSARFCGSVLAVDVRATLIAGSAIDSIAYFGAGVIDSTLNPNSVFVGGPGSPGPGTGGTSPVWAQVTDSFGCKGYDTVVVTIVQAPVVDIDSVFNKERTVYGINNDRSDHTYCKSDSIITVNGNPVWRSGGVGRGTITGIGIFSIDTTYYYDPSLVPAGVEVDTVVYSYTDDVGCENTDIAIIKLDSVPIVSLIGFVDTNFCPNYDTVQLRGIPDVNVAQGTATFSGPGVNPNSNVFTPSAAGTGNKSIVYRFVDSKGCVNSDTVNILVNPLPPALFTKRDPLDIQYCTTEPDDTLFSSNDPSGTFFFYGSIITDSIGILTPGADTVGSQQVYYSYTDTNNCTNIDSATFIIYPTPEITVSGLDSVYCFSDLEDNISISPSGILYDADPGFSASANSITFDPDQDSAGIKTFSYRHVDNNGCSDTITARTYVFKPTPPTVINLDTFYCETKDTFAISGSPTGGIFTGRGIYSDSTSWAFIPDKAGSGSYTITYSVEDTLNTYVLGNGQIADSVCPAITTVPVTIRPLPVPKMTSPADNSAFCSNDTLQPLLPSGYANRTWTDFRDTSGGLVTVYGGITTTIVDPVTGIITTPTIPDTTYFFDPGAASGSANLITYFATDSASGCSDSINFTIIVDGYVEPDFALKSAFCESDPAVLLFGAPGGGVFARNGDTIVGTPPNNAPFYVPNPGYVNGQYLTTPFIIDTITYRVVDGACEAVDTQIVEVNRVPQVSYTTTFPHNTYCMGGDTVWLTPNIQGGVFSGGGVPFGTDYFIPDFAGRGESMVSYAYEDSTSGCRDTFFDAIYVYSMPVLDYDVAGGCQYDSVYFEPNNAILGLISNSRATDSITSVQWVMSSTYDTMGSVQNGNIDTMAYLYDNAGVYWTQLIVANQQHCIDTHTVRLVISPKVDNFPYEQDFESGDGEWFAEAKDSTYDLLWNWGADSNPIGIPQSANKIWSTSTAGAYGRLEDAWVYSPCFDLSNLERPMMSMDYWTDTREIVDGTVLEYQKADGTWAPVGEEDRGINWYNTTFIAAQPGSDRDTSQFLSLGWSGQSNGWQDGRYKLDNYRGANGILRMRFAFASVDATPGDLEGFAFDNVVVRSRTRNVLLESMVNDAYSNMEAVNNRTYDLIFHTPLKEDVVLLQYHIDAPNATDAFHVDNDKLGRNRSFIYAASAGRAYIDGDSAEVKVTANLTDADFEQDMLASPKFEIEIDGGLVHINNTFNLKATVRALEPSAFANYRIYTVISEDSLNYPVGSSYTSQVHAVARENDQFHLNSAVNTTQSYSLAWNTGDSIAINFSWDHTPYNFINYEAGDFQAVVFIQNTNTKEIYQVATTRDVSRYAVGVDPIKAAKDMAEIQNMVLYPNPAHDYFNLKFDNALEKDYQWRLVDVRGVEVSSGTVARGTEQVTIDGLNCPAGAYFFLLYNDKVTTQRKVILGRP